MVDPVGFYILREVEKFVIGKVHIIQKRERGSHIWALIEGTAAAVNNNGGIFWKFGEVLFKFVKILFLLCRANVYGVLYDGSGADAVDDGLHCRWGIYRLG
jgi:hypothetical protein